MSSETSNKIRRVLITGASGMVGRNLLEHESKNKYDVLCPLRNNLDLEDYKLVQNYLREYKPDLIIHAAGKVGGIAANIADPYGFLRANLLINYNIINCAKDQKVPRFLNIASSCMYPKDRTQHLLEEDILTGSLEPTNEGYALAKIVATKLCEYSNLEGKFNYKTIIPCNLYGRHDTFDLTKSHLIPSIIIKIHNALKSKDQRPVIWGDGSVRREFMYSGDLADFIWTAVSNFEQLPGKMNVGLGRDFSVREYYETVAKVLGYKEGFDFDLNKPIGMKRKVVNVDKLEDFGWRAQTSLEDGILKTYEFCKSNGFLN